MILEVDTIDTLVSSVKESVLSKIDSNIEACGYYERKISVTELKTGGIADAISVEVIVILGPVGGRRKFRVEIEGVNLTHDFSVDRDTIMKGIDYVSDEVVRTVNSLIHRNRDKVLLN